MKKKTYLAAAVAGLMTTGMIFAGSASAANSIETAVTSTNIGLGSECGLTSPVTFTFDADTVLTEGEEFTITLPLQVGASVSSCKDIDIVLANRGDITITPAGVAAGTGLAVADIPAANAPITSTAAPAVVGDPIFRITGTDGGQIIKLAMLDTGAAAGSITVAAGASLSIELFKQKVNAASVVAGADPYANNTMWLDDPNTSGLQYTESLNKPEDNAFCIDVSNWPASVVQVSLDSNEQAKYTYTQTNKKIAAIVAGNAYSQTTCKDAKAGIIRMGDPQQVGANVCGVFTNNTGPDLAAFGLGYCDNSSQKNFVDFAVANGIEAGDYTVTLEILVDGAAGDNGVYFAAGATSKIDEMTAGCTAGVINDFHGAMGPASLKLANGKDATPADMDVNGCDLTKDTGKAIIANYDVTLVGAANSKSLRTEIPSLIYTAASNDQKVEVKVSLTKKPCGVVAEAKWDVGTFGERCDVKGQGTFPYFAAPGGSFWNGLAVVNYSDAAGDVKLTIYEADGDVGEATVNVAANSMFVNTLRNMILVDGIFTQTGGTGTLGDSRSYIVMNSTTISIDGFSMIANNATGESMGYLPRR